jgi:hypothetical protein
VNRIRLLGAMVVAACVAVAFIGATSTANGSGASKKRSTRMLLGIMDDALLGNQPDIAFQAIAQLRPQIIRYDLDWPQVAPKKPRVARDPDDPAYQFGKADDILRRADALGIPLVLTIVHTPAWAGGTKKGNHAPRRMLDLQDFAYAAATRYSGTFTPAGADEPLPAVTRWTAWNEPNFNAHLTPQFKCVGGKGFWCKGGKFITASPQIYVSILNAIYRGIHSAGSRAGISEVVAAGVTKPGGAGPTAYEPSIAPLKFLRLIAAKHAKFDVYAHHPYRVATGKAVAQTDNVGFTDLNKLFATLDKYYPGQRKKLWITEYGVQTKPPDPYVGVSFSEQAKMLRENVAIARANPRVDMLIWFLIRDEDHRGRKLAGGFQTGLENLFGKKKPSFATFQSLAG